MADTWLVRGSNLTLGYKHRTVVHDLSLEVARGDILGIVGPNGCGKTTLLLALLGLLRPIEGRVERLPGVRISYVPQRDRIDTILPVSAMEVVLMGRAAHLGPMHGVQNSDRDEALRALALLGAEPLRNQLFRDLSGGQQQRVLLARALAGNPDLLVLDEPTAGMDVASEAAIIDFLGDLNRSRSLTVLIVTHLLPIVLNFATSIILMCSDAILQGAVEDVLQEDRLTGLYGVPVHLGVVAGQRTLVVGRRGNSSV